MSEYECSRCARPLGSYNKSGMCQYCICAINDSHRHDMAAEYLRGDTFEEIAKRRGIGRKTVSRIIYKHFPGIREARAVGKIERIIDVAASLGDVSYGEIIGSDRSSSICRVRNACYLVAHEVGYAYAAIGRAIGNRDHSTVVHGAQKAECMVKFDADFAEFVLELQRLSKQKIDPAEIASIIPPKLPPPPKPVKQPAVKKSHRKGRMNEDEWDDYHMAHHRAAMRLGSIKLQRAIEQARTA